MERFREQVKALVRFEENPGEAERLPVPWEYDLLIQCESFGALPVQGAILDQPHILMICFNIIKAERAIYRLDKKKREEANRRLREQHEAKK